MTIDEAIVQEIEVAKEIYVEAMLCHANPDDEKLDGCIERGKYHEQLAEWLEELKAFKENKWTSIYFRRGYSKAENDYHAQSEKDRQSSYDCGYDAGYNMAIDDFVNACKEDILCQSFGLHANGIERIAEQLKAGERE